MSTTATETPTLQGSDDPVAALFGENAQTFTGEYRFADGADKVVASLYETATKARARLTTWRNVQRDLAAKIVDLRYSIVRPNGDPDLAGESDQYQLVMSDVLDTLVSNAGNKAEQRAERNRVRSSLGYHVRNEVRSRIAASVRESNPDADAEQLEKLTSAALAKVERPNKARAAASRPSGDSPEDEAAAESAARTKAVRAVESISDVAVPMQAESILRLVSAFYVNVESMADKGIPGRDKAEELNSRSLTILHAAGKVLSSKATESDKAKATAALWAATSES